MEGLQPVDGLGRLRLQIHCRERRLLEILRAGANAFLISTCVRETAGHSEVAQTVLPSAISPANQKADNKIVCPTRRSDLSGYLQPCEIILNICAAAAFKPESPSLSR